MKIHSIDLNNDWTFGQYKIGSEALEQDIRTKLQEWTGDCFFNLPVGIDWINRLNNATFEMQKNQLLIEIRSLLLKIDGIINVMNVNVIPNFITRNLQIYYNVNTVYNTSLSGIVTQIF